MLTQPFRPEGGDLDLDASLDALAESRAHGVPPDAERLKVRGWRKRGTALCLVVDRSGSMGGRPLATSAVAAAAIAHRAPADYSVLAFAQDVVVAKAQDHPKPAAQVVTDVLALRGFGTTDLVGALTVATRQLQRSPAGRRVAVLLSDCRATVPGDVVAAARGLDELCIVAPASDAEEARVLAASVGARLATVDGPSDIPDALASVLGE
jgi:Mg-chelatase subunit ChlD